MSRRIDIPNLEEIAREHRDGASLPHLGAKHGVNEATLRNRLIEEGYLEPSRQNTSPARGNPELIAEVVKRYQEQGQSPDAITKDLRSRGVPISKHIVRQMIRSQGIALRTETARPRKEIPNLSEVAQRIREGEDLVLAAASCGVSEMTLRRRLAEAGLNFRPDPEVIDFDLSEIAERYRSGEPMSRLSEEIDMDPDKLRYQMRKANLLPPPHERENQENPIWKQLPEDEIVQRYEGEESISSIVEDLRRRDIPATAYYVNKVLDRNNVIRHRRPGGGS